MTSEIPSGKSHHQQPHHPHQRRPSPLTDAEVDDTPPQPLYANLVELRNASNVSDARNGSPVPSDRLQSPVHEPVVDEDKTRPKSIAEELPAKAVRSPNSAAGVVNRGQQPEFCTFLTPTGQADGRPGDRLSREVSWFHDVYSGSMEKVREGLDKGVDPNLKTSVSIVGSCSLVCRVSASC